MVPYESSLPPPPPPLPEYLYQDDNPSVGASGAVGSPSALPLPPPPLLPEYWHQDDNPSVGASGAVGSPSALPLSTLHLEGTPPPPYTAELPQMHRVIQMGGNIRENQSPVNHGLLLPMEKNMPSQNNRSGLLQNSNEELTTEQSRGPEKDVVRHSTKGTDAASSRKDSTSDSLDIETSSPIRNPHRVLPSEGIHNTSHNPAGLNTDKDEADVKPNSQSSLLSAIRNFNPGLLKTVKEKNSSNTTGKCLLPREVNGSLEAGAEPVRGNENSASTEDQDNESSESDFRTIINQALMKRRADILDSSQESVNESYCSEWDL